MIDNARSFDRYWRGPTSGRSSGSANDMNWRDSYHSMAYTLLDEKIRGWYMVNPLGATLPWSRLYNEAYQESARIVERAINEYNASKKAKKRY